MLHYATASKIQPGDLIRFKLPHSEEREEEVVGHVHVYPGDSHVVYVPIRGLMVNRLYITWWSGADA